jgi:exodeoxyribonuclease VII small subunit
MSDKPAAAGKPADSLDAASLTFDQALTELQRIVAELEQGGLPLERSIELYERGVALHERCAALLGEAELRVQRLLERAAGELSLAEARSEGEAD